MHQTILVITQIYDDEDSPKSYPEMVGEAFYAVNTDLPTYCGMYFDYYDTDDEGCNTFLTTKSGEKCQACRVTDFKEFTDGLPADIVYGTYIDSDLLEKYGVDWSTVVERELRDANDDDIPSCQTWLVAVDVHI